MDDDLARLIEGVIEARKVAEAPRAARRGREEFVPEAACVIRNMPYNPACWNRPEVQPRNNCYNYAMNYRSDTFAQPGRISGRMYTALNCANVGAAA